MWIVAYQDMSGLMDEDAGFLLLLVLSDHMITRFLDWRMKFWMGGETEL